MKRFDLLISSACILFFASTAVAGEWIQSDLGETAIVKMENAPYPHKSRENGHMYEGQNFLLDPRRFQIDKPFSNAQLCLVVVA